MNLGFQDTVEGMATVLLVGLAADEAARLAEALQGARYRVETDTAAGVRPDVALVRPAFSDEDPAASPWREEVQRLGIPIIALISASRPDQIERAIAAGATEVLIAPANATEMLTRVRKVLRLVALRAEAQRLKTELKPQMHADERR